MVCGTAKIRIRYCHVRTDWPMADLWGVSPGRASAKVGQSSVDNPRPAGKRKRDSPRKVEKREKKKPKIERNVTRSPSVRCSDLSSHLVRAPRSDLTFDGNATSFS